MTKYNYDYTVITEREGKEFKHTITLDGENPLGIVHNTLTQSLEGRFPLQDRKTGELLEEVAKSNQRQLVMDSRLKIIRHKVEYQYEE